jgi:hypothetical protein
MLSLQNSGEGRAAAAALFAPDGQRLDAPATAVTVSASRPPSVRGATPPRRAPAARLIDLERRARFGRSILGAL